MAEFEQRRNTDSWVLSHALQTVALIVLMTTLIMTVIIVVKSYQAQNGSYQAVDLCRSLWTLQHRETTIKYDGVCEHNEPNQ